MKKLFNSKYVIILFALFLFFLIIQHQFLYLYHDDYGYASLSYEANIKSVIGHAYNITDIINYLFQHYMVWGGRILFFFIEIVLLGSGIEIFRIVQSIVILFIFLLIYLIGKENLKLSDWKIALATISMYGVFNVFVIRDGIFWITASVLYIFPILFLLLFIYFYNRYKNYKFNSKINKILFYIICVVTIFCASFSQEQIAVATLFYVFALTIYNYIKHKKIDKLDVLICFVSLTGFLILMLAPGNQVRSHHFSSQNFYSLTLIEKIIRNVPQIIINNFSQYNKFFSILLFCSVLYCSYKILRNGQGNRFLSKLSILSCFIILLITAVKPNGYFENLYYYSGNNFYKAFVMLVFISQIGLAFYSITVFLLKRKEVSIIILLYSALLSQGAMVLAPYFPHRATIIFEVISFIFITNIISNILIECKENKKFSIYYIIIPILVLSVMNVSEITIGYYKNSSINKRNDYILSNSSKIINSGGKIEEINLNKLHDITYSGEQPYISGNEYILIWMREYYNIPEEVKIIYK